MGRVGALCPVCAVDLAAVDDVAVDRLAWDLGTVVLAIPAPGDIPAQIRSVSLCDQGRAGFTEEAD